MKYLSEIPRSAMEVYNMLPEGTLCEVIDNTIYMSPSPTTDHQRILGEIFVEIKLFLKQNNFGQVYISPCDVYLDDEQNVVQPDIIFVGNQNAHKVKRKGIIGAPDLVMQVLSTNVHHDKKRKLELYERNGIPEYIIIDPDTREAWQYVLIDHHYQQQLTELPPGRIYIRQLSLSVSY